jgi:hypothetical protein
MTVFSTEEHKSGSFNFAETVYPETDLNTYKEYFPGQNQKENGTGNPKILPVRVADISDVRLFSALCRIENRL